MQQISTIHEEGDGKMVCEHLKLNVVWGPNLWSVVHAGISSCDHIKLNSSNNEPRRSLCPKPLHSIVKFIIGIDQTINIFSN
jgi:hypothetical protein